MTDVDWSSLADALPGAPQVAALAAGLETDVPVVLLPVRVETRFDQVETRDSSAAGAALTAALTAQRAAVRQLADRNFATTLRGSVRTKKAYKNTVEAPLYATAEKDIEHAAGLLAALRAA